MGRQQALQMKKQNNDKWYNKPIWRIILITFFICCVVALVDVFNIPSRIGITSVNIDAQVGLINTIITIALFTAAYVLIDRWEAKKNNNKQEIAKKLLEVTYIRCKKYLDPQLINVLTFAAGVLKNQERYEDNPFENNEQIVQLAMDGIITVEWFKDYLSIKSLFETYINAYQAFKDDEEMREVLDNLRSALLQEIDMSMNSLEPIREKK